MDAAQSPLVQLPSNMGHDQVPSPLSYEDQFPIGQKLDMSAATVAAKKNRRPSKSGPPASVKRSVSSPNVRSLSAAQEALVMSSEKKRNKLGYHRTSVACVHCRRRKIRCLLAPDDSQNRCSNCIRLKKECNFFPVDQQPPSERRPRAGSKADARSGELSASSSSSPSAALPQSGESGDPFAQYQQMSNSAHGYPVVPMGPTTMSPPSSASINNMRFDVPEQSHGAGWDPRFFENQHMPPNGIMPEDPSQAFWKAPDTPITPGFSPYSSAPPTGAMPPNGTFPPFGHPVNRPDHVWQLGRSMSYSQIDGSTHHRQESHGSTYVPDMRRSTVDMPPPSLHSGSTSTTTSMSDMPTNAQPGNHPGQPIMQYGMHHPGWNILPTNSPKTMDFGGWYAEPNSLGKVQEDEVANFGEHLA